MTVGEKQQSSGAEAPSVALEKKWTILCALQMEERAIRKGIKRLAPSLAARKVSIEVRAIGINASRLKPEQLKSADLVILLGFAGGLDPDLAVGDVVIVPADQPSDPIEQLRRSLADRGVRAQVGPITCVNSPVLTPADKTTLRSRTGAIAVEMEADRIRAMLGFEEVPLVHARVISDSADQGINPAFLRLVDDLGRPRPNEILRFLITCPQHLQALFRVARQSKHAAESLASLAEVIMTIHGVLNA